MNAAVITEESNVRIWPTHSVVAYFVAAGRIHAAFDRTPIVPDVSPGSLKVSDVFSDGKYRKTIVFRIPESSRALCNYFFSLVKTYVVLVYTDSRGVDRVMGSLRWPAYLSVERSGGSLQLTFEALGDAPNPEFVRADP